MPPSRDTPVLVGVGEASESIHAAGYGASSPLELAARAAAAALKDTACATLPVHIDVIAAVRQFEISKPEAIAPFGRSDNFPRSVANRIGSNPAYAILDVTGGQSPQFLVNEMAHSIARHRFDLALLVGAEAISSVRHLMAMGKTASWGERVGGQLEDRGYGLESVRSAHLTAHGLRRPIHLYGLFENARRGRLGLDRPAYLAQMASLMAPFSEVAATNPHAASQTRYSVAELKTITPQNRLLSDPFPRRLVSRDQTNQGAAIIMTSTSRARQLGIPENRWVYLHGGADVVERGVMERQDLSAGPASKAAVCAALNAADMSLEDIDKFDLYSCFPIAVSHLCDALGLPHDDQRGFTVTGGLPFFGGAGNNYSMHAIAAMVRHVRSHRGAAGLVGANGGYLSKYSVGIYSARPKDWKSFSGQPLQAELESLTSPPVSAFPNGEAEIETYTIDYDQRPAKGFVIGRLLDTRERFVAQVHDNTIVRAMTDGEPLAARIHVGHNSEGLNVVTAISHPGMISHVNQR